MCLGLRLCMCILKNIKWVIEVHFEKLKHNYGPNSLLALVMHLNLMFGSKDCVCLFDYVLTRKTCLFYLNSIVLRILWKKRWKCKFIIGKRTDTVCSFVHLFIHSFIWCLRTDHVLGIVLGLGISNAQSPSLFRFYIVERRRTGYEEINIQWKSHTHTHTRQGKGIKNSLVICDIE